MNPAQKRRRRVEIQIDQRLLSFLKPKMTVKTGLNEIPASSQSKVTDFNTRLQDRRGRAS